MIIRCWGSRGSVPVSGNEYLKYGGDTTCMEIIGNDGTIIIVDAGTGIRKLGNDLSRGGLKDFNIIFTHAHWDHLMGFPFFKPIYTKGISLHLYGCPFAQASIKDILSKSMSPPYFPVNFEDLRADISYHGACSGGFDIGSIQVTPILLSHPNQGIGYKFVEEGKSFVFLTDNELTYKHPGGRDYREYLEFSANADLLIHDSEYTREEYRATRGWGHSTFEDSLRLALEAHVHQFGLFHHNQDRTDAALDGIVETCENTIDDRHAALHCFAVSAGTEISL
jgi:phosphoribosyl 1,2-cyclic phosphodiesterase